MNTSAVASQPAPTRARIGLAVILFITLLISYLDRVNVSVLIADPKFLADMGIAGQPARMGLLMTTFLFAYGLSNLVAGPIGSVMGPRKAMLLAVVLWAVSVGLGGLAGTFPMMIAARILLGVGEGLHWPMQSSFVKNWFPIQERAKANSAWLLGIMIGPMISMPILSAIVGSTGWRVSFGVLVLCSFLPMLLIWFFTSDQPSQSKYVNQAELTYIQAGQNQEVENAAAGSSARSFLTDSRFWLITIAFLSSASMFWGTVAWLPSYLKVARGFSWGQMGSLATLPYILGSVTVVASGYLADRVTRKAIFPIIALFGAAASIFAGANVGDNYDSALCMAAAIGFLGMGLATYWTMMQAIVSKAAVGAAAGVMNGVASLGSALVPTVIGLLIQSSGTYFSGLMFLVVIGALGGLSMVILSMRRA